MKKIVILATIIIFAFGMAGALKADDNSAATGVTTSSDSQAASAATPVATPVATSTAGNASNASYAANALVFNNGATTVGGQIKLTLFTGDDGVSTTGTKLSALTKKGSTEYGGFSFNDLWLFIGHQISDVLSVEIEPEFAGSTGATPRIGTTIGQQLSASSPAFFGLNKAYVKYEAPYGVDISGGLVKPILTMDYGEELFWDEEFYGSKFAANSVLGEDDNIGVEVYKAFSIGDASLPVWLYALNNNASDEVPGNNQPAGMIHVEPEYGMFKLSGSYEAGTWDTMKHDPFQRTSGGIVFNWQGLQLRGEYASGRWNDELVGSYTGTTYTPIPTSYTDEKSQGYYVKAIYKLTDWLKLVYDFNDAYQLTSVVVPNSTTGSFTATGAQRYITNTLMVDWSMAPGAYLMLQIDYADWYDVSGLGTLNFVRTTLGTRVTF